MTGGPPAGAAAAGPRGGLSDFKLPEAAAADSEGGPPAGAAAGRNQGGHRRHGHGPDGRGIPAAIWAGSRIQRLCGLSDTAYYQHFSTWNFKLDLEAEPGAAHSVPRAADPAAGPGSACHLAQAALTVTPVAQQRVLLGPRQSGPKR